MASDQLISPALNDFVDKMDQRYAKARQALIEEMASPAPDEAVRLVRWIMESGIDPDTVFSNRRYADWMSDPEGILAVMNSVRHAIRSRHAICYPMTAQGPYVSFLNRNDWQFHRMLMEEIERHGPGKDVIYTHSLVGFVETIDEFMEVYEAIRKDAQNVDAIVPVITPRT